MCHVSRPCRKCILSERKQLRGVAQSRRWRGFASRFTTGAVSSRDQFARIRPKSTISSEVRGRYEPEVRSAELRVCERVSRALWTRGVALRGLWTPQDEARDSEERSLHFKLKGNSKYRPLTQSDELSVTSFPRRSLRLLSLIEFRASRPRSTPFLFYPFANFLPFPSLCQYDFFCPLLGVFKLFKLRLFSMFGWVPLSKEATRITSLWKFYATLKRDQPLVLKRFSFSWII